MTKRTEALKRAQRRHDAKRVTLRTSVRWPTQQAMDAALAKCRPGESLPALLKRLVDEYEPTNGT